MSDEVRIIWVSPLQDGEWRKDAIGEIMEASKRGELLNICQFWRDRRTGRRVEITSMGPCGWMEYENDKGLHFSRRMDWFRERFEFITQGPLPDWARRGYPRTEER